MVRGRGNRNAPNAEAKNLNDIRTVHYDEAMTDNTRPTALAEHSNHILEQDGR